MAPPTDDERALDPKGKEKYTFSVRVKHGNGTVFSGTFTNRILLPEERIAVGLLANRIVMGTPWALVDGDTTFLVTQLAHMRTSLTDFPEGFKLGDQKNLRVIDALWKEVLAHERYFRGPDEDTPASAG